LPLLLKYDNKNESFENVIKNNMNVLMNMFDNQDLSLTEINHSLKLPRINNTLIYQQKIILNNDLEKSIFMENEKNCVTSVMDNSNANSNIYDLSNFDITFSNVREGYRISNFH